MKCAVLGAIFAALVTLLAAPAFAADMVYYYSSDTLHSEVVVTDQSRNVVERTHYAPYGQVLNRDLRDGPGYTGHEEDPETGLVYMQQRYYDPEAGRFLSVDPVQADGGGGSFNRYEYAEDNPYTFDDPFGEAATQATGRLKDAGTSCQTGTHIGGGACGVLPLSVTQVGTPSVTEARNIAAQAAAHANSNRASNLGQNHVAHPANGFDAKSWEFRQELTAGNTATVDSSGGIAVQSGSIVGPFPTDQFRYMVTQRPLNENGTYQVIRTSIDWGNPRSYSSGLVGYGITHMMIFHAPLPGPGGNRWFVTFPLQESAHGNATNEYLDIYVPREH